MNSPSFGLYIHIPFCSVKCAFCDFAAYPGLMKTIPDYLSALEIEMQFHHNKKIETVFVGGGTPTVLDPSELKRLFSSIHENFRVLPNSEISVECNPESVSIEKLTVMKQQGVNRLSFGLQAIQDSLLQRLGRQHNFAQFLEVYQLAQSMDFSNLNIDLMYGLPQQTFEDWKMTIEKIIQLQPQHLSAYALTVEDQSSFHFQNIELQSDPQVEMYEYAALQLENAGYSHYEISNFAKPGYECKHNLRYWKNQNVIGIGASASGYENGVRKKNHSRIFPYMEGMKKAEPMIEEEYQLSAEEQIGENLMLALRLKEGADWDDLTQKHYGAVFNQFKQSGHLYFENKKVRLTREGWLISNQIFQELV